MFVAHLVPGYFAAIHSQAGWNPQWSPVQRYGLWIAALASTAAPDLDVMYNALYRGYVGHSILLTHSLIPYAGLGLAWWLMRRRNRWVYLRTLVGFVAFGGLSHVLLDAVGHGTPLLYPFTTQWFGSSSVGLLHTGFRPYPPGPVFFLEPILIAAASAHWLAEHPNAVNVLTKIVLVLMVCVLVVF